LGSISRGINFGGYTILRLHHERMCFLIMGNLRSNLRRLLIVLLLTPIVLLICFTIVGGIIILVTEFTWEAGLMYLMIVMSGVGLFMLFNKGW